MYSTVKKILFQFDPETAHELVGGILSKFINIPLASKYLQGQYSFQHPCLQSTVAGLDFANPVGMAAGFDKTGELYPFLCHMGFGFVESGTFTAHAQPGNERPRLFRYPAQQALINRMGFNNPGSEAVAQLLPSQKKVIPRGINLGKSKITELEKAPQDYLLSLQRLQEFGDYIVVNVSSPNTPGLRQLQDRDSLENILTGMQTALGKNSSKPIFVKLAPDLTESQLEEVLDLALGLKLNGVILTNTTLDHSSIPEEKDQQGGLSGAPLKARSTAMIKHAFNRTKGKLPIIGVGGIASGQDALDKIKAGASLVQIYTGYIYEGPALPARINRFLAKHLDSSGQQLSDIIGSNV